MIEEPDAHASETSQKPNSSLDHSTISAPRRDRCVAQVAAADEEVEDEVAVGDRVDRVRDDRRRSRARGPPSARSVWKFTPASAPAPSGSSSVAPSTNSKRRASRRNIQKYASRWWDEVDGLRALEVGVAGHRPVEVALGEPDQRRLQRAASFSMRLQRVGAGEHRHVGGHLVVARARRVQLAADRRRRSRSAAARSPCGCPRRPSRNSKRPSSSSSATRSRPASRASRSAPEMISAAGEHLRVRPRLLDVVRAEPPVEADRGVQLLEDGVLWLRRIVTWTSGEVSVRPARPDDRAAAELLYASAAPYYDVFAGIGRARPAAARRRLCRAAATPPLRGLPGGRDRRRGRRRARRLPGRGRATAGPPLPRPDRRAHARLALAERPSPPARARP